MAGRCRRRALHGPRWWSAGERAVEGRNVEARRTQARPTADCSPSLAGPDPSPNERFRRSRRRADVKRRWIKWTMSREGFHRMLP